MRPPHQWPAAEAEPLLHRLTPQVQSWLSDSPWGPHSPRLLDFGCGSAEFTRPVAEHLLPSAIYLVDLDPVSLSEARDELSAVPGAPEPLCAPSLEELAVASAGPDPEPPTLPPVDLLLTSDVLHHLDAPATVLSRLLLLLSPGGMLILRELRPEADPESPRGLMCRLHELKASVDRYCGLAHGPLLPDIAVEEIIGTAMRQAAASGAQTVLADSGVERGQTSGGEPGDLLHNSQVDDYLAVMDRYLEHAAGSSDFGVLRKELARIGEKAVCYGLAPLDVAVYRLQCSV